MAKTHVVYAHLADNAFQSEGGKLNLIGVFAGIGSPGAIAQQQFPAVYPRLALAMGFSTTAKKLPLTVTFRTEDGTDIVPPFSGTFEIDRSQAPKAEAANVNFNLNFDAFQLQQPGKAFITVETGEDELAELELNIVQSQPTQQT